MTSSGPALRADRYLYPMLRAFTPVLRRGPDELQIGLDQEPSLILVGVNAGMERLLALLDGCHHIREIELTCLGLGVDPSVLEWTLRTLDDAQLLSQGGRQAFRTDAVELIGKRVRLIGAGTLGKAVAELIVGSGISVLNVIDNDVRDGVLYPAAGAVGTQAEGLRSFLGESRVCRVSVANHWTKPEGVRPDLTIVASDTLECDRVLAEGLLRADQPHLFLRTRAGGVVVGPLVLPGQTACLRCMDLTRRDADPAWPTLLPQLARTRMPTTEALSGWAGGVGAAQALGFLKGATPETCGATIEISPADFVTRWRSWSMHPACGCGWGVTAQWGA